MKARIADITHPWPLVADTTPDLGGQRLIGIYAMRHEVAEGAARVHDLLAQIAAAPAVAALLILHLRATPASISMLPADGGLSNGPSGRQQGRKTTPGGTRSRPSKKSVISARLRTWPRPSDRVSTCELARASGDSSQKCVSCR